MQNCKIPGTAKARNLKFGVQIDYDERYSQTSRPAIAGNPRCSVFKLGPKYNCEKRASNIALSYSTDVDK